MLAARLVVASSAFTAWISAQPAADRPFPNPHGQGVAVEQVTAGFGAARAALQEDDVILGWVRDGARGAVDSPFALSWLEVEQAPRSGHARGPPRAGAAEVDPPGRP